jgi:hypothetical protein
MTRPGTPSVRGILFSDMVGSTELRNRLGASWSPDADLSICRSRPRSDP